MNASEEQLERLRRFNRTLSRADRGLNEAILDELPRSRSPKPFEEAMVEETIVLRRKRPVLAIKDNQTELVFRDEQDSVIWKDRLVKAKDRLGPAIKAVGRIDLAHNAEYAWVGTGWLVDPEILVTNRHVANVFGRGTGATFTFRPGVGGTMAASIDFLHEIESDKTAVFQLEEILHIEAPEGPDLAFLRITQTNGHGLAQPIRLGKTAPVVDAFVATIGYPAMDSRIPDFLLMQQIFGQTYDKKRLAPGSVTSVENGRLLHDCTTLGGNSGSVILDLDSGDALGLHFSGLFLQANHAVRADVVQRRLDEVKRGNVRAPRPAATTGQATPRPSRVATTAPTLVSGTGPAVTLSVPLVITVSLGNVTAVTGTVTGAVTGTMTAANVPTRPARPGTDDLAGEEAPATSYADRRGYEAAFLGKKFSIPRPEVVRDADDVLVFGQDQRELDYEHFSVQMSQGRRMCRWSACNIDGQKSKKSTRAGWRTDPRIPKGQQILNECYGSPPKFSRGHMTRREDPAWGTPTEVARGNQDSMHVTNTVPQMQSFNAPIWLGLEDYALQHAREDDMKISVFTGPYLDDDNDPTYYGVQVPVAFWKIIAFIHDETGQLCATGYEMTQQASLPQPEFVFGNFVSPQLNLATQVPIRTIEIRSGIDFGNLASRDPLSLEGVTTAPGPLRAFDEIRFV